MAVTKKQAVGYATIDVNLVVIRTGTAENGQEIAIDTANSVSVEPQTEQEDAVKLVKLGRVLAQKPPQTTITGNLITLTDNVFIPEVAKILQGGTFTEDGGYTPPLAGDNKGGEIFELDAYSAIYDEAGVLTKYQKITYPNCQGTPFGISMTDGTFRLPEYTINSAPKAGQAPFTIENVDTLPLFDTANVPNAQGYSNEPYPEVMMANDEVEPENALAVSKKNSVSKK